ncbi:MAG: hypothetical protein LBO08_00035 [Rickettsiales bacterium]|jgi:hypothetical protein|nr:hypothetical protein [Rickettsiales bacterium]
MTRAEFLNELNGWKIPLLPVCSFRSLELAQSALQQMKAAILPAAYLDLLQTVSGGLVIGDAVLFNADKIIRQTGGGQEIPGIIEINRELAGLPGMGGKTLIGRNGLFWFTADSFGNCYMLDIITLSVMRKYENDFYGAVRDCLAVGRV